MLVDGTLASVSSVNWSQNSFTNNREAGLLVSGSGASSTLSYLQEIFEADWATGQLFQPTSTYSTADLAIIQSTTQRQVTIPIGPTGRYYVTPTPEPITGSVANFTIFTSPDWSYTTFLDSINSASQSLSIYIYQITDTSICDAVKATFNRGVNVTLLVSNKIYSSSDQVRGGLCREL